MSDETFDVVATFLNRIDADLACTALEAAGIESTVSDDDGAGTNPELWLHGVRILVRTADLERARAVLDTPVAPPEPEPSSGQA